MFALNRVCFERRASYAYVCCTIHVCLTAPNEQQETLFLLCVHKVLFSAKLPSHRAKLLYSTASMYDSMYCRSACVTLPPPTNFTNRCSSQPASEKPDPIPSHQAWERERVALPRGGGGGDKLKWELVAGWQMKEERKETLGECV